MRKETIKGKTGQENRRKEKSREGSRREVEKKRKRRREENRGIEWKMLFFFASKSIGEKK